MKHLVLIALSLALVSCITDNDLHRGMALMKGKPITEAIGVLGYPASSHDVAGRKVYAWGASALANPLDARSSQLDCSLQIAVDKNEKIVDYSVNGSRGACERFTVPLYRYAEAHGAP